MMKRIEVSLGGRRYTLSCQAGQEQRLQKIAAHVEVKVQELRDSGVTGSELQLLALTCLTLADRVFDLSEENATLRAQTPEREESVLAANLDGLATRLEDIVGRLERA